LVSCSPKPISSSSLGRLKAENIFVCNFFRLMIPTKQNQLLEKTDTKSDKRVVLQLLFLSRTRRE
jgi:hypothetical protein